MFLVTSLTKSSSEPHYVAPVGITGPHSGARSRVGAYLVTSAPPTDPSQVHPEDTTWNPSSMGHPSVGELTRGYCDVVWVAVGERCLCGTNSRDGTWYLVHGTSLGQKEPELVWEVERYRLAQPGLWNSVPWEGLDSIILELLERQRAGVGLLVSPTLSYQKVEFTPVDNHVPLPSGGRQVSDCGFDLRAKQRFGVPYLLGVSRKGGKHYYLTTSNQIV